MSRNIPVAPVGRILKNVGAQRISVNAEILLADILEAKAEELAIKAVNRAQSAGRKTVKKEDIKENL